MRTLVGNLAPFHPGQRGAGLVRGLVRGAAMGMAARAKVWVGGGAIARQARAVREGGGAVQGCLKPTVAAVAAAAAVAPAAPVQR